MARALTTLVLGAGSSCPYGFPSGVELRSRILKLSDRIDIFAFAAKKNRRQAQHFLDIFTRSQLNSIDSFLAKNPEFSEIGKTAIAMVLLHCENESLFLSEDIKDHWYRYLVNSISPHSWDELDLSWLTIISFNYDRSLRFYLHDAFKNMYQKSDEEVQEKLHRLQIHYVYGALTHKLAAYGKYNPNSAEYYDEDSEGDENYIYADFQRMYSELRVIPEGRNDDIHLEKIRNVLLASSKICILGFGFDPTNIERINESGAFGTVEQPKRVVATTKGMTTAESERAKRWIYGSLYASLRDRSGFIDADCTGLLRETLILDS